MNNDHRALVERIFREAWESGNYQTAPPRPERPSIHFSELPDPKPDDPMGEEYNLYRREAGRLIAEGYEGKYVLINGQTIFGPYESLEEAFDSIHEQRNLFPFYIHKVMTREPLAVERGYRLPW